MTNSRQKNVIGLVLGITAALLLVLSLNLPLWCMRMESPQYQGKEALRFVVYPGSLQGDLKEIHVLNQYIGVTLPEHLPQLKWLPYVLLTSAVLGIFVVMLPEKMRCPAWLTVATMLALAIMGSAALAQWQMYQIGHDRKAHTVLRGVKDFTPHLIGRVKIENFTMISWFGISTYLVVGATALYVGSAIFIHRNNQKPQNAKRFLHHPTGIPA